MCHIFVSRDFELVRNEFWFRRVDRQYRTGLIFFCMFDLIMIMADRFIVQVDDSRGG